MKRRPRRYGLGQGRALIDHIGTVAKWEPDEPCLWFHRWELHFDGAVYDLDRCQRCGARRAVKHANAHGVFDRGWVATGTTTFPRRAEVGSACGPDGSR